MTHQQEKFITIVQQSPDLLSDRPGRGKTLLVINPRAISTVTVENKGSSFTITMLTGECHSITPAVGLEGREVVRSFLESLGSSAIVKVPEGTEINTSWMKGVSE